MSFTFITNDQIGKDKKESKPIVNKKISEILVNLVNESLRKKERQLYYSKFYYDDPRKPHEILKEELSKPIVISRKEIMHFPEESRRDIQKILMNLRMIPGLYRFLKFNCISEKSVEKAAGFMKYEHHKKGTFIFKQGDKCDKFYGIIQGEISIRVKNHFTPIEKETTSLGPGMCFGEWAMIYDIPRTASAYATCDVDLFYLNKEYFEASFEKEIIKADIDKKNFVTSKIPPLLKGGKIQNILCSIVPCVKYNF